MTSVWAAFLMIVPTGLVLGLVAFGRYGSRDVRPNFRNVIVVGIFATLLGPVAVLAVGFLAWIMLVAVGVALLTMLAVFRTPRSPISS